MHPDDAKRTDAAGSALVVIGDDRVALALVLVLQEMDLAVDVAVDGPAAVEWARRAAYDLIVCAFLALYLGASSALADSGVSLPVGGPWVKS